MNTSLLRFLAVAALAFPAAAQTQPLALSLNQAVDLALAPEGNARAQLAREMIRQARARAAQSRASLLPTVESGVAYQNQTRNLAAFGIRIELPIPGFHFPAMVGPFNTFDARATASQSLFDAASIRRFQAARTGVRAAESDDGGTRDQVTAAVAKAYLAALAAAARVEAAQANASLAGELLQLATRQKEAGVAAAIEITRAHAQLNSQRQLLLVAVNQERQARRQLLRTIGLDLDTPVDLTGKLVYTPAEPLTATQAAAAAMQSRGDLKAQQRREEAARLGYSAVALERVPTLVTFADYGSIGTGLNNAIPTRTYGLSLRVPVFDGGRRDARRGESAVQLRQERIRTKDLREQVGLEVRQALDTLHSSEELVKVAEEGLALAEAELEQARRRYQAGVTPGIELTDAQTRLERARENRIAVLFAYNAARIDLGQAMGAVRRMIP